MANKKVSVVIIGAGGMARAHVGNMFAMEDTVRIAGFVEIADTSRELMTKKFTDAGKKTVPPFYLTLEEFLAGNKGPADVALIVTPHNIHVTNIMDSLDAGMDTLCEKPMVLSAAEARRVIKKRDETGRRLSVAFPGSYSPAVRKAKEVIAAGEIGEVMSIAGYCHQHWMTCTAGSWRQIPKISGGGFLFDTGSHTVNTMIDLAGADVKEMTATQDNRGTPVDIATAIQGRFKNGVFFTLCAEGNSINCTSCITIIGTKGILATAGYGGYLKLTRPGKWETEDVPFEPSKGVVEQFLRVRAGKLVDPCPAEVGLRFSKFMDMVRAAVKK